MAQMVRPSDDSELEQSRNDDGEHTLVCLSASPSNAKIIRTAARMVSAFGGSFTALFIETPGFAHVSAADKERLRAHCKLAEQLGASVEMVYGDDVPYQIAEYCRLSGVTKLVLGRSVINHRHFFGKPALTDQLLNYVPDLDIHIIPDKDLHQNQRSRTIGLHSKSSIAVNILKSLAIFVGTTVLSLLFHYLGVTDSNIIMLYILCVLLTSLITSHQIYSLVSSVSSVLIFNYLFTYPRFSFAAYGTGYPITFVVMFLTAYITGTLAMKYKAQAKESAKNAYRTKVLFDTDQMLSKTTNRAEMIQMAGEQIRKLLQRNIVIYGCEGETLSDPYWYCVEDGEIPEFDREKELQVVRWVLANCHSAGAHTDNFPHARFYYLAIRVNERVYGVVGIDAKEEPLEHGEHGILLSILGETALAIENDKIEKEKEAAAILAKSEQLRANLLRTISHDLRTPLTSISGNASNLLHKGESFDAATKHQMYSDIYDDSLWLIHLVENLLYATRIEDGRMTLSRAPELVSDIIEEAMRHISRQAAEHTIVTEPGEDLLMVRADAKLLMQVLINLVNNAIKYTPVGSTITVRAKQVENMVEFSVADTGNGIPDAEKEKVFEKFYTGANRIADNRRSIGLGLFLCKSIVEAHGGTIGVEDCQPHGCVFRFSIPAEEVTLYE